MKLTCPECGNEVERCPTCDVEFGDGDHIYCID
ncbi:unnamed protein product, partial [marine sediment metagenome]